MNKQAQQMKFRIARDYILISICIFLELCILLVFASCRETKNTNQQVNELSQQFSILLQNSEKHYSQCVADTSKNQSSKYFPRSLADNGDVHYVASSDWCSGFFPGCLWLMAELTQDSSWQLPAIKYTQLVEKEKWNGRTHDMGFKIMSSFGQGFRQIADSSYAGVIVQSAQTLCTRFNPTIGCIRSWDHHTELWSFPVIIDNMMNLELLFKATEITGDSSFYKIAVQHANTTMRNHFRPDYSSYHVVDYIPETGEIHEKSTLQGDNRESSWARGQAWGLYGFTMCFKETRDSVYLHHAQYIADYIFRNSNMPADLVPMWDFDYNESSNEPRDVSAAAIIASALYDLANYSAVNRTKYVDWADKIMYSLQTKYQSKTNENKGFLLGHSVGFRHQNSEVDQPLIYADYYYLEALLRKAKLKTE